MNSSEEHSSSEEMPVKTFLLSVLFLIFIIVLTTWFYQAASLEWDWADIKTKSTTWSLVAFPIAAIAVTLFATNTSKVTLHADEVIISKGSKSEKIKLVDCFIPEAVNSNHGAFFDTVELFQLRFKRKTVFGHFIYFKTNHFFFNDTKYNFAKYLKGKVIEAQRTGKGLPTSGKRYR